MKESQLRTALGRKEGGKEGRKKKRMGIEYLLYRPFSRKKEA